MSIEEELNVRFMINKVKNFLKRSEMFLWNHNLDKAQRGLRVLPDHKVLVDRMFTEIPEIGHGGEYQQLRFVPVDEISTRIQ